jgi:putative hemolysin
MRYEDVSNIDELNQMVVDYQAVGYKVENRSLNYVKLVKNDFSIGVFIILLFFLIIGALIYWAIKSGQKDEIIIRVKNDAPINVSSNAVKHCVKCGGAINSEDSEFCPQCGVEI